MSVVWVVDEVVAQPAARASSAIAPAILNGLNDCFINVFSFSVSPCALGEAREWLARESLAMGL
jgi:hypothetical protein